MHGLSLKSEELLNESTVKNGRYLDDKQFSLLFAKYKSGDLEARNTIIECNIRLISSIAKSVLSKLGASPNTVYGSELYASLVNEGVLGLIYALSKYDIEKAKFSTYVSYWIKEYMRQYGYANKTVSMPAYKQKELALIHKVSENYERMYGKKPTTEILSELTGVSSKSIEKSYQYVMASKIIPSIDSYVGDLDDSLVWHEVLSYNSDGVASSSDPQDSLQFEMLNNSELKAWIASQVELLEPREQFIVNSYFGLNQCEKLNYVEIGKELKLTKERARQIWVEAKKKLLASAIRDSVDLSCLS